MGREVAVGEERGGRGQGAREERGGRGQGVGEERGGRGKGVLTKVRRLTRRRLVMSTMMVRPDSISTFLPAFSEQKRAVQYSFRKFGIIKECLVEMQC